MSSELLQKAIKCLAISDVYLRDTRVTFYNDFDPTIADQSLHTMLRFSASKIERLDAEPVAIEKDKKQMVKLVRIHTIAGLRFLSGELSEEAQKNPDELAKHMRAEIIAFFVSEYRVTCDDIGKDAVEEFARRNVAYHVWPYWREYAQNVCNRTHLPAVIMPMFQLKPTSKGTDAILVDSSNRKNQE